MYAVSVLWIRLRGCTDCQSSDMFKSVYNGKESLSSKVFYSFPPHAEALEVHDPERGEHGEELG